MKYRKGGIDYDSKQITIAILDGKNKISHSYQVVSEKNNFIDRFNELENKFIQLLDEEELTEISKFVIEDSIYTRNPRATLELAQMKGMMMSLLNYFGVKHFLIAPQEWKKQVLGSAKGKENIAVFIKDKYPDLETKNSHLLDAICIALAIAR